MILYKKKNHLLYLGRITPMLRQGAGVKDSWSWTKSNFHPNDLVDISYTNPTFTPSYSILGFSKDQLYMGKIILFCLLNVKT